VSRCLVPGRMGLPPPEADRPSTIARHTDAGARGARTLFQPLPPGLDPTGTRPPAGAPSGRTHSNAARAGAGTHFGEGQLPNDITWGGGSVPPPAREPACSTMNRDHLGEEGCTGRPSRSCVTR